MFETNESFTVSALSDDELDLVNGGNKVVDVIAEGAGIVVGAVVGVVVGLAKAGLAKLA